MKTKKKLAKNMSELVGSFQMLVKNKPPINQMYEEIRMMKFRIRPLQGNVLSVNLNNEKFIEVLWSMGKLDEFYQSEFSSLTPKNKQLFIKIFEDLHIQFQEELNRVNLLKGRYSKKPQTLEMEIYKEKNKKVN
ncbi:MAG: hypothetical protein UR68_C0005G0021 [Candidatus Roizmanbacteria bacterium GW2011_GWA2_35_19]|uniref:Uncharacterized protein n=2 Tax=Candidatus Roizmaniibacteriota TaxID=1752723 RepID=A0A0G0F1K6_9BACT|nr:MAG: hypothetical protein UR63_C0005G0005 [Candidatus Roizmanbacteria bacterium GW2011_GWC2_35_12]KKP73287.1 MAG: hypothetical protein UR68_C0005G0021 [Candidatus Roizmanbacteria bacterium GW2011_GWA2_35_19]